MSGAPNLANAVINLNALREFSRRELVEVLDSVRGRKGLVLDPTFVGPLGLVAEVALIKERGVDKMYHLVPERLDTECKNVVYLCRPKVKYMKYIADHIHQHEAEGAKKEYWVFFVPRRTMICERVLEEEGVYGNITVGEYHLDLIPFDEDVLSLELDTAYRECLLDGDRTSLFYVARSLMKLQSLFGLIPNIKGKGILSRQVADMMLRMRREMGAEEPTITPEIDTLILLDRDTDMITPVCTQLTYEGLIDEVFGIQNTYVDLDAEIAGPIGPNKEKPPPGKKIKVALNSNDKLYNEIRNLNFSVLGPLLNRKAKEIDEYYKTRHGAQTVSAIRDFMKKLASTQQEHNSLNIHTNITEKILGITKDPAFHRRLEAEQCLVAGAETETSAEYIEECINKKDPLTKVLRLLILLCCTQNGLKPKQLEFFKREILQTYGFEYTFTLNNFEKLGLLRKSDGRSTFAGLRRALRLVVDDIDENNPSDIAYVYSGYAPLSVRLVQQAFRPGGWRSMDELLRQLPGPTFEEGQVLPNGVSYTPPGSLGYAPGEPGSTDRPVTLVFFIGGCTFTEIAALRFLSEQQQTDGIPRDFIIATTKLINGDTLIDSLVEQVELKRIERM
eukprot:TRINITY_DN4340_c0_g6_i1.p1 TRINITY_DN4340_c0_g6~~TRINITY_DN4340_c0_g6_i1.p1  ORF type:complete len:617 (-),score=127.38 TRINITY_DN4340_c0_g6_i1:93-1943(-)